MLTPQEVQRKLIIDSYACEGIDIGWGPRPEEGTQEEPPVQFLYRKDKILVREEHLQRVQGLLREAGYPFERQDNQRIFEPVTPGVGRLQLTLREDQAALDAVNIVSHGWVDRDGRRRSDGFGAGIAALDYVVSISPGEAGNCPAVEPEPVPAGSPPDPGPTTDRCAGEGIRVVVVDTGIDHQAVARHPWLWGVTGEPDPAITYGDPNELGPYAGHGTFIAGVLRSVAPLADVHVRADFDHAGAVFESDLVAALDDVLDNDSPDIISMSAGAWSMDSTGLLSFEVFNERRLRHHKGVVLVTAAGNDGDRKPFWPAAAPYTVSVGALATKYRGRAGFSNYGGWVDVYAPGQDMVNAFPFGEYKYTEPPNEGREATFYGMARWSGTSFSTPFVAGLIAARMSRTGENGRDAARALLRKAHKHAQPGVGAVLLPT
jgi:subtilisin family serine protease